MPKDLVKSGPSVLPAYTQRLHTLDMPAKPNPLYLALWICEVYVTDTKVLSINTD